MARFSLFLSIVYSAAVAFAPAYAAADEEPELVGEWGRVERIVIEGAKAFDSDKIRLATRRDVDCIAASRLTVPLDKYPRVLADRVRAGYVGHGFLDAQVAATINREREAIVISVVEGRQYRCGPIEIEGGAGIDEERLRDWITSEHPPADARLAGFDESEGRSEPRWVSPDGSPAQFNDPAWRPGQAMEARTKEALEKAVRQGLADQGFRFAMVKATAEPVGDSPDVPLVIKIVDPGPLARIDAIDISGSDRDSAEEVQAYLGIKPGDVYTNFLHAKLWHKLWMSGRYLHHHIEATKSGDDKHSMRLEIKLVDYAPATPLRDPLQPAEQSLLKFREWILGAGGRGEDLMLQVRAADTEYEMVYSENRGLLALARPAAGKDQEPGQDPLQEVAFLARAGEISLLHAPWQKKYQAEFHDCRLTLKLHLQPELTPKPEGQQFTMQLGLGFKHGDLDEDEIPFRLAMDLSPTAMLSMAHRQKSNCTIADGVLTIAETDGTYPLRLEAETGRLLEWRMGTADMQCTLAVESGAFTKRMAHIEAQLAQPLYELPNDYDPDQLFGTLVKAILESPLPDYLLHTIPPSAEMRPLVEGARRALAKMCAAGVLQPLDDLKIFAPIDAEADGPGFTIPLSKANLLAMNNLSPLAANAYMLARLCDDVFPHGSWSWVLWRDLILWQFSQDALGEDLLPLMQDNQMGPLAILCLTHWPKMPVSWIASATRVAVERTTSQDFALDYRPLLERGTLVGDLLHRWAAALRDLSEAEVACFDSLLFDSEREVLVVAARTLRHHRNEELSAVLPIVLNQLWDDALREPVQSMLRELSLNSVVAVRQSWSEKRGTKDKAVQDGMPEQPTLVPRSPDQLLRNPKWNGN